MKAMRPKPAIVVMLLAAVVLAACSRTSSSGRTIELGSPDTGSPAAGTGSVTKWIGVLRTEADPNALDVDTAAVKDVVDGSIVVSPVACFDGLPAEYELDAYLLGVVAPTKRELDGLLTTLDRTPIFEGQVRTMCLD